MKLHTKPSMPNLFIIGSMKSGTTSLHEYMSVHPDIFMSAVKEPGYFAECINYYPNDEEWYVSLFQDVKDEKYAGESSTHYAKLPTCGGVVDKIWEFNPGASFIYIMRNPIKRAISHYWHNIKSGDEHRDMLSAIESNNEYIDFSDYAYQLEPYISRFGRDKLYTIVFEDLVANPDEELIKLFRWLEVDDKLLIKSSSQTYNALPEKFKKVKGRGVLYRLRHSALWSALAPLVPKKITTYAAGLTEQEAVMSADADDSVFELLKPVFHEKIKTLEALLNKDFSIWKI